MNHKGFWKAILRFWKFKFSIGFLLYLRIWAAPLRNTRNYKGNSWYFLTFDSEIIELSFVLPGFWNVISHLRFFDLVSRNIQYFEKRKSHVKSVRQVVKIRSFSDAWAPKVDDFGQLSSVCSTSFSHSEILNIRRHQVEKTQVRNRVPEHW